MPANILIAEDDPVSSQILQLALEEMGYGVTTAADGQEAWELFQETPPPIVVSDWDMPEMDGISLVSEIRNLRLPQYTYCILLTAKSSTHDRRVAMDAGVDDFLTKPLNKEELYTRIRVAERILNYNVELSALKQVIPICSYCKMIRRDDQAWQKLEIFLEHNLNKDISHSICPDCYRTEIEPQFREIEDRKRRRALDPSPLVAPPGD